MSKKLDEKLLAEILAEHADALNRGEDDTEALLARYPEARGGLEGLLGLTSRLRTALVPVEPPASFIRELGESLSQAAINSGRAVAHHTRQTVLIIMAVLGPVIGLIALLLRRVHHRHGVVETK